MSTATVTTGQPSCVCVHCCTAEVAWHELLCPTCQPTAQALGLLPSSAAPDQPSTTDARIQIGPTDI